MKNLKEINLEIDKINKILENINNIVLEISDSNKTIKESIDKTKKVLCDESPLQIKSSAVYIFIVISPINNKYIFGCDALINEKEADGGFGISNDKYTAQLLALRIGLEQIRLYRRDDNKITIVCSDQWLEHYITSRETFWNNTSFSRDLQELGFLVNTLMNQYDVDVHCLDPNQEVNMKYLKDKVDRYKDNYIKQEISECSQLQELESSQKTEP